MWSDKLRNVATVYTYFLCKVYDRRAMTKIYRVRLEKGFRYFGKRGTMPKLIYRSHNYSDKFRSGP